MASILLRVYVTPFAENGVEETAKWSCDAAKEALAHATGQMVRCFAMKTNFGSLHSRNRPQLFLVLVIASPSR
jgi:hypothetical protein